MVAELDGQSLPSNWRHLEWKYCLVIAVNIPISIRAEQVLDDVFHRVNRIIPEHQELVTVDPSCPASDAIALMLKHGYSQVPVIANGNVLGVFSFRSFAREAVGGTTEDWVRSKSSPGELAVDEFLEQWSFARVQDDMVQVFGAVNEDGGILIGTPERLIGILTPTDTLDYLYHVASPFVLLSEIELALRVLINSALDDDQLIEAAKRCLKSVYGSENAVPTSVKQMTFDNYQSLISFGENWIHFEVVFGGTRPRTQAKLKQISAIRNDVFHFKREIGMSDHEVLVTHRNWLLSKVKQAEPHDPPEGLQ